MEKKGDSRPKLATNFVSHKSTPREISGRPDGTESLSGALSINTS